MDVIEFSDVEIENISYDLYYYAFGQNIEAAYNAALSMVGDRNGTIYVNRGGAFSGPIGLKSNVTIDFRNSPIRSTSPNGVVRCVSNSPSGLVDAGLRNLNVTYTQAVYGPLIYVADSEGMGLVDGVTISSVRFRRDPVGSYGELPGIFVRSQWEGIVRNRILDVRLDGVRDLVTCISDLGGTVVDNSFRNISGRAAGRCINAEARNDGEMKRNIFYRVLGQLSNPPDACISLGGVTDNAVDHCGFDPEYGEPQMEVRLDVNTSMNYVCLLTGLPPSEDAGCNNIVVSPCGSE